MEAPFMYNSFTTKHNKEVLICSTIILLKN